MSETNTENQKPAKVHPNYFKFNLLVLLAFGIDILEIKNNLLRKIYYVYAVIAISFSVFIFLTLEAIEIFQSTTDFYTMSFGLCYFFTQTLGAAKVTILLLQRESIRTLMHKIESGIFRPNLDRGGRKEFDLINTAIKYCNNQVFSELYTTVGVISMRFK